MTTQKTLQEPPPTLHNLRSAAPLPVHPQQCTTSLQLHRSLSAPNTTPPPFSCTAPCPPQTLHHLHSAAPLPVQPNTAPPPFSCTAPCPPPTPHHFHLAAPFPVHPQHCTTSLQLHRSLSTPNTAPPPFSCTAPPLPAQRTSVSPSAVLSIETLAAMS